MWTNKYRPKRFDKIVGNQTLIAFLRKYGWKKPLILYGPSGTGKSCIVECITNEFNLDMVEITDDNIDNAVSISQTSSLYGNRKLIVVDNVDQIRDMRKVTEFLKETRNPTILVTSDFSSRRLGNVKRLCEKIQTRRLTSASIKNLLFRICKSEGISADNDVLMRIAENSNGDVRAAINDLETIAKGKNRITMKDAEVLETRDRSIEVYKTLSLILMKKDAMEAYRSMSDLNEQPRDVLLWIDENLPRIYRDRKDIERSYYYLSRSDVFLGRIIRRQYWGFLRYVNALMSLGVNVSRKDGINFTRYQFPSYLIKMSKTKKDRNIKVSIGQK
ncbi:MAG TPA: AAA family ATPase, partial [Candidatus Altiarchaeales archaeon]|nr:AAA family ATPase [Candidatus Altiarchaeales archaeon]